MAEWWLKRQGRIVLPRLFIGVAIGGPTTMLLLDRKRGQGDFLFEPGHLSLVVMSGATVLYKDKN